MSYIQSLMTRLAKSPKIPGSFLTVLSRSKYDNIRKSVADNDNTPSDILVKLTEDGNSTVKDHAKSALFRREE